MATDEIRADYEQLAQIARRFADRAEAGADHERLLRQGTERLRSTWRGRAANAFFAEMEGELLPALTRLTEALSEAQRTTVEAARLLREAEEQAAALFQGADTLSSPQQGTETASQGWWDSWGEWIHGGLDVVGFIPGIGEVADGLNALIYLGEGRYVEAGISAAAMIPILGDAGKLGKWGVRAANAVDAAGDLTRVTRRAGDASDFLGSARYLRHTDNAAFESLMRLGANDAQRIDEIIAAADSRSVIRGYTDAQGNAIALVAGNRDGGLRHVVGRHLTGTIPGSHTTLFPPYAKVDDVTNAIGVVLRSGTRTFDETTRNFVYTAVHPQFGNMKVIVDQTGGIVSAYPTR